MGMFTKMNFCLALLVGAALLYKMEYILQLGILLVFILVLYKYLTSNFDYWAKRGVQYAKPLPLIGCFLDLLLCRMSIGDYLEKVYNQFNAPYFGIWAFTTPILIIKSPDLIKSILVKDFQSFHSRIASVDENVDTMASNFLFFGRGERWKSNRYKMAPFFSTGKLKHMFETMNANGETMVKYLHGISSGKQSVDARELMAKFATDILTSTSFGVDAHSFEDDDAQFRALGRRMFGFDLIRGFINIFYFFSPRIVTLLKIQFFDALSYRFLRTTFRIIMNDRKESDTKRNDMIDIMIKIKEESEINNIRTGDRAFAQAGQVFAAGFETVSSTISFTLYELALNTKLQDDLRDEIKSVVEEHGGINYDSVKSMEYLNKVVSETLRKYPVLPFLERCCATTYNIPGSDLTLEKGTGVYIPMMGLHYDPEYYPEPHKYDPERFSKESREKRPQFSYIPFGEGPHNCIGERYGLLVTKIGLIHALLNFEIEKSDDTPCPLIFNPHSFLLQPVNGLPVKFNRIEPISNGF